MRDGKLFGKISIVDIVAVLLIIAAAAGIYLKFGSGSRIVTTQQRFEYVMLVEGVRLESVNALQKMGPIMDGRTHEGMGKIKEVTFEPSVNLKREMADDGRFVAAPQPDKYDVRLVVEVSDGKTNDTGYYTALNKQINVGSQLIVETKYAKTSAEIISITNN